MAYWGVGGYHTTGFCIGRSFPRQHIEPIEPRHRTWMHQNLGAAVRAAGPPVRVDVSHRPETDGPLHTINHQAARPVI